MRSPLLWVLLLIALSAASVSAGPLEQDAPDGASLELVNSRLRTLHDEVVAAGPLTEEGAGSAISRLRGHLRRLVELHAEIERLKFGDLQDEIITREERRRACAWLHGWAVMSRLVVAERRRAPVSDRRREELLGLGPQSGSALHLLLKVYRQMTDSNGDLPDSLQRVEQSADVLLANLDSAMLRAQLLGLSPRGLHELRAIIAEVRSRRETIRAWRAYHVVHQDPLRLRLRARPSEGLPLSGRWPGWPADGPGFGIEHPHFIPARADLVGRPAAAPELQSGVLSLWALINLQIDTWRTAGDADTLALQGLSGWMTDLEGLPFLSAFDEPEGKGNRAFGNELRKRVKRMRQFLEARSACADEKVLDAAVREIAKRRLIGGDLAKAPIGSTTLEVLVSAASPLGEESLPQAGMLLRYLTLLSYREAGLAGAVHDAPHSVDAFFEKLCGDSAFAMAMGDRPETDDFLRWDTWPRRGHFMRNVSDATQAAYSYLRWEDGSLRLARENYRVAGLGTAERQDYGRKLSIHAGQLDETLAATVRPHFRTRWGRDDVLVALAVPAAAGQADFSAYRRASAAKLNAAIMETLLVPNPRPPGTGNGLAISSTPAERKRLDADLSSLQTQLEASRALRQFTAEGYLATEPGAVLAALKGQAGLVGLTTWGADSLPRRPFSDYEREVTKAVTALRATQAQFSYREELAGLYRTRVDELESLRLRRDAERLAVTITERGVQIQRLYGEIAERDRQIAELGQKVAKLLDDAQNDHLKETELRLALRTRAYDLAVSQLAALERGYSEATGLVKDAQDQLRKLQPQLLEAAKSIEDQQKRNGLLSIVKAAVTVIGAVLAPFTGGATALAATGINAAIGIYEKLDGFNFDDLPAAARQIAGIVQDAQTVGDIAFDKLGVAGDGGREAWNDLKTFVREKESQIKEAGATVRGVEGDVKVLLEGIRREWEQSRLSSVASALVTQLPVSIDDGSVRLDLSKVPTVVINDHQVSDALKEILDSGGIFAAGIRDRALAADLPFLKPGDEKYRENLARAVDQLVAVLPGEMLKDAKRAAADLTGAKQRLTTVLSNLEDEQRQFVSRLLMGWAIIRTADGRIVAAERPLAEEVRKIRARAQALADGVQSGAVKMVADRLTAKKKDLQARIDLVQSNAPGLRTIAQEEIPALITGIDTDLRELEVEIEKAKEKVDQNRDELKLAELDVAASKALRDATKLGVERSDIEAEVAILRITISNLERENADDSLQKQQLLLGASDRDVSSAEQKLRVLYGLCVRNGVVVPDSMPAGINPLGPLSIMSVLNDSTTPGSNDDGSRRRAALTQRAAEGLLGMAMWVRLLSITTKDGELLGFTATQASFEEALGLAAAPRGDDAQIERIARLAEELRRRAEDRTRGANHILFGRGTTRTPDDAVEATWLTGEARPGLEEVLRFVPEHQRDQVIGVITYRYGAGGDPVLNHAWCQYALPSESVVLLPDPRFIVSDLSWAVVSPGDARPNPALNLFAEHFIFPQPIDSSLPDCSVLRNIQEAQWKGNVADLLPRVQQVRLTGAHGMWHFVIVDKKLTEANRGDRVKHWKEADFEVLIPILNSPGSNAN